jgi:hypothetical protein
MVTHIGFFTQFLSGFSTRPVYSGNLLGTTVLIILSIYMGPVAPQVNYYQAIHSILCCAYNHSYHCDFNNIQGGGLKLYTNDCNKIALAIFEGELFLEGAIL